MLINFETPQYLIALLIIPIFVLFHFLSISVRKKRALLFANFEAIGRIKGIDFFSKNITVLVLSCVATFLLIMAVAGTTIAIPRQASSFSFVLAIDSSKSMMANDLSPTRLDFAKKAADNFIDLSPGYTPVGVISFSGVSLIKQEITPDKIKAKYAVDSINQSNIEGTDINELVITASNLLENEKDKAIVIFSDGQVNVGTVEDAVEYAKSKGVLINAVAVGTDAGGDTTYGLSRVDKDSLRSLAFNTGGKFFEYNQTRDFNSDELFKATTRDVPVDISKYLVVAAFLIFCIQYIIASTKYGSFS